ncbi:dipeptidase [Aquibacillus koreensis]|uniref:Dipeptidase n=1 Tax=Aquibacillus koreensis TaxID=279446 RepID=A0A9X3WP91_9BACI|nr:dipeptidase [Aquibacillus koreensis]MCT2534600.1 dipeptidase [Aquibacillus koreensis]MDC3421806.1 dipeptidase [Aquibacillus koreensis]
MNIIDAHCDVLFQLWEKDLSFFSSNELQVNYKKWMKSSVKVQCFAIFVPDYVSEESQFNIALEMVDLFYTHIIEPYDDIKFISSKEDLLELKENERGAVLTLEGCHVIGRDIAKLKTLIRLGVRAVGLTWNQANAVCDGIGESRGAGLSIFGKEVVETLNKERIWTDVSHLSYQGFFDVMEIASYPMASHSNVKQLCSHRRNLDEKQISSLIERKGWMGITFVSSFLADKEPTTYQDVIRHILYVIQMGGSSSIGFGSDFDGATSYPIDLKDCLHYNRFVKELAHYIDQADLQRICYQNFIDKFPRLR